MATKATEASSKTTTSIAGIPMHLKHIPVVACNYDNINTRVSQISGQCDGVDAKYISVGHAQYDSEAASVKVMRHIRSQWSPQSEEVPIQRVPYMMALLLASIYKIQNPDEEGPCSENIKEEIVPSEDIDFLRAQIFEWRDFLKDGIAAVEDLLKRIDVSKIGK